jgi:mono/diheme cytochrome c family protein
MAPPLGHPNATHLFLSHVPESRFALDQGARFGLAPIMVLRSDQDQVEATMKYVVALMAVLAGATGPVGAQDAGDPVKGAATARQVCAECHAVGPRQRHSFNVRAPAFEVIATTHGMTSIALTAALRTSHRVMPNIVLGDDELRNVVAYILSLKLP